METGHDKVQGTDYAYTLHGWIKAVNSNSLREDLDIGQDGIKLASPSHVNTYNAKDVYGYSLTYYDSNSGAKDYRAINNVSGTSHDFIADVYSAGLPQTPDLFNGNIRRMTSSYLDGSAPGKSYVVKALLRDFNYDQLNRIEAAGANTDLNVNSNSWRMASGDDLYMESFSYDQNGNILRVKRNGDQSSSVAMDDLSYHYVNGTNKLDYVADGISGDPYNGDISNQLPGNYDYDKIGNLLKDNAEGISNIEWTVYGKIKKIDFASGTRELIFKYDASGNRISKIVHDFANDNLYTATHYVRDAQGNVMATYNEMWETGNDGKSMELSERYIYGSSRLGIDHTPFDLSVYDDTPMNTTNVQRTLGNRSYELSNHLGNVMAVVSDRKIAAETTGDNITDYFTGEVLSANDYYAFGSNMPGRSFTSSSYRYGFNGKELDPEGMGGGGATYDYGFRIYNPNLGRFLSVDPLSEDYPWYTPYQFAGNTPIWAMDLDGLEEAFATDYYDEKKGKYIRKITLTGKTGPGNEGMIQFKYTDGTMSGIVPNTKYVNEVATLKASLTDKDPNTTYEYNVALLRSTSAKDIEQKKSKPVTEKKVEEKIDSPVITETPNVEPTQKIDNTPLSEFDSPGHGCFLGSSSTAFCDGFRVLAKKYSDYAIENNVSKITISIDAGNIDAFGNKVDINEKTSSGKTYLEVAAAKYKVAVELILLNSKGKLSPSMFRMHLPSVPDKSGGSFNIIFEKGNNSTNDYRKDGDQKGYYGND